MAAHAAFAGSTVIGKRCMFAGHSGTVGHITICDDVIVSGKAMMSKDITEPGVYAGSFAAEPVGDWNRQVARFRRLEKLNERVSKLEKKQRLIHDPAIIVSDKAIIADDVEIGPYSSSATTSRSAAARASAVTSWSTVPP